MDQFDEAFLETWRTLNARTGCILSLDQAQDLFQLEQQYGLRFGSEVVLWQQFRLAVGAGLSPEYVGVEDIQS